MRQLISALPVPGDERVLTAFQNAEDAAVYQLDEERALVVSIDIITPLVDDAVAYGAISAANALSDVYAMGGEGLLSLSFLGIPKGFPMDIASEILRGGAALAMASRAPVLGGHTVESKDVMFGLAAVGLVHPQRLLRNDSLRPGDVLILTKPLGTGTLTTAVRADALTDADIGEALDGMRMTNAAAVAPLHAHGVRAATDITGFGLLGHAAEMARASGVQVAFAPDALPEYPRAREMMDAGHVTRANTRNREYVESMGPVGGDPEPLLYDPQTSGGLLVAVMPARAESLLGALRRAGYRHATRVGDVRPGAGVRVG